MPLRKYKSTLSSFITYIKKYQRKDTFGIFSSEKHHFAQNPTVSDKVN